MSTYADDTWEWVAQPLRDLRERCRAEPEVPWDERLGRFLADLGLSSAEQHPVLAALADRVARESDPIAFVADDSFEAVARDLVVTYAIEHETRQAATEESGGEPAATTDPATVADNAVVTIGLPAVRDLAAFQPELVAGEDLAATLTVALAHRLTAQPDPYGTALSTALARHLELWISANPVPAGEFYAVFDVHTQVAQQWVEQATAARAGEFPVPAPAGRTADGTAAADAFDDLFTAPEEQSLATTEGAYLMPDLVERFLREVPGAEALTPDQINDAIREALADNQGSTS